MDEETAEDRLVDQLRRASKSIDRDDREVVGTSLCSQCMWGVVFSRSGPGVEQIEAYCTTMNKSVPPDVIKCTGFSERGQLSLRDLVALARIIDTREGINEKAYR